MSFLERFLTKKITESTLTQRCSFTQTNSKKATVLASVAVIGFISYKFCKWRQELNEPFTTDIDHITGNPALYNNKSIQFQMQIPKDIIQKFKIKHFNVYTADQIYNNLFTVSILIII